MSPDSVPLPFGVARRLGQPRASRIDVLGSGDIDTFRRRLDRSWVSWRDGSMAGTGGVGNAINPATGAVQSGPMTMDLAIPGCPPIRMGFAWDAITNLAGTHSGAGTGLASNVLSGLNRTIIEDTSTGQHYVSAGGFSVTNALSYSLRFMVRRAPGSTTARHANIYWTGSGHTVRLIINLTTGTVTPLAAGSVTITGATATLTGDGYWLVSCVFAQSSGSAVVMTPVLAINETTDTSDFTYTGDGVSGVEYRAVTLTPLTDYAPLLAEGITRTADSWIYTLPAALPQDCEITHIGMHPYSDGDPGVTSQMYFEGSTTVTSPRIFRSGVNTITAEDFDAVTAVTDILSRTLPSRATAFLQRLRRTPTSVEAGYGATMGGSPTAIGTAPWRGQTTIRIGHGGSAGRASRAANALIITPGGCTQAERDAEARLFHLKPVGLVA